ncbi:MULTISPECIES: pitrilysin [Glaesserella]|uniref:Protease 3 n=1 Tax=Glaesserella australis TaxID=2094024 RepID=A0A328C0F5_9PAST|nr:MULTISPECIES: pitrilysin [Glaesserella]AUI66588.1 pitrilysin [Glaesserella sp. 15-184]RAL18762.1 pitrilysin [Glaesserella australis]
MKKSLLSYTLSLILGLGAVASVPVFANSAEKPNASTAAVTQAQQGFELIKTTINKSPTDKAIYQGIRLANGMEVLLISDEKANKSLMSVGLPVGSMEDPVQQQGLAHYLEHMILMGSKAFPETNSLDGFLTKNGGYNNAYTAPDRTIYYLEVNNNAFDEAVARLADAFAQPLLSETNAKKEVNAVNAEMVRAKSSDSFLMHDVNLATANPNHPITKFAVGNNVTLSDKADSKLQDELLKFYQQYYSANLMKAVLYANQPIEKLAKLAEQTLGKVTNKQLQAPTVDMPFFRAEDKAVMIHYKPVKSNKMLAISFDMPEDKAQFKHKTGAYLAYVFNNNTDGTLSDYLIKQGLSDSGIEAAPNDDVSRNRGDFTFYIDLTDKGLAEKDKIISLVFQQIDAVKKAGAQPSYFKEMKESLSQDFQHLQTEKSGDYVAELVSQMISYPLEHIIDQPYVVEEMDEQAVNAKLDAMTLDNARILLVDSQAQTDKKTKYFEAPYSVHKISDEQKAKWLDFSQNPTLKLPALNPYFATDFSLNEGDKSRLKPKLIAEGKGTQIYAMPSHYFGSEPKVAMVIGLKVSPEIIDLKQGISAALLGYMADLAQTKLAFQASVAGISAGSMIGENGAVLTVEGYTQHLPRFIQDFLTNFRQFELTEPMLAQAKQRYLEALDRAEKENALRQASAVLRNFASHPYFEPQHKRKMVEQITLADLEQIRTKLLTQATSLRALSVGNFNDTQVKSVVQAVESLFKNANQELDFGRYLDISQSQRKLNHIKSISHQDNALTVAYFPNGYGDLDGASRVSLLKDILSRWYFDDLRTDKQLGYAVHASSNRIGKTSGLQFSVQSPTASPQEIMQHNERFFNESWAKLKAMSSDEFEKYRASLLELLQHKPESLGQEFSEFLSDFSLGNSQFDRKANIIEIVKQLTKQDILDFYQQAIIDQKGFVFASQAIGTNPKISQPAVLKGFEKVESIEALQKSFEIKRY